MVQSLLPATRHNATCCAQEQVLTTRFLVCSSAENVKVRDAQAEGSKFDLVEGSLERSFSTVDAGRSAEFTYVLIPKAGQKSFLAEAATVTYNSPASKSVTTLLSTAPYVVVLSTAQNVEIFLVKLVCTCLCAQPSA
jgi:hypothetical protein